jgi:predicted ArsR family transcriptional regulator
VSRTSPARGVSTLGAMRRRVLHQLRVYGRAASAVEVGEPLGLHPNTARFHLDALVDAGLAERSTEGRATPGRPKVLYAVPPGNVAEEDGYRVLAEILTGALEHAATTPGAAAEAAGVERGRVLAGEQVGPRPTRVTAASAADVVVEGLGRLGFESSSVPTRAGRRIDIVPCPYLDLARSRPDVVCAVQRGLMQGVLDELGAPIEVDRLEPFAEPGRCVAHLRRAG